MGSLHPRAMGLGLLSVPWEYTRKHARLPLKRPKPPTHITWVSGIPRMPSLRIHPISLPTHHTFQINHFLHPYVSTHSAPSPAMPAEYFSPSHWEYDQLHPV